MITIKNYTKTYYGILKDDEYLYDGAKLKGHDYDSILKVENPIWIDFIPADHIEYYHLFDDVKSAIDTLQGILKYAKEDGSEYRVTQIDIISEARIVPGVILKI